MDLKLSKALTPVKLALMDTAVQSDKRRLMVYSDTIQCKSGCSGCCSRLVEITVAEAVLMYEHLCQTNVWAEVRKTAREQIPLIKEAKPLSWFKMNLKCPVLDLSTQKCRAYSVRPATCSTHFVESDPALCDPWSTHSGEFKPLDFDDLYVEFRGRVASHLAGYGILSMELPIPLALLLAERINTLSGLTVEQVMTVMFNEL